MMGKARYVARGGMRGITCGRRRRVRHIGFRGDRRRGAGADDRDRSGRRPAGAWIPAWRRILGFDIDVAKYVAKTLGYAEKQIVFKQLVPGHASLRAHRRHPVDMVVDSFSMDRTHDGEAAAIARTISAVREALLIRSDSASEITGTDSLSDKTVCAVAGSAAADNIRNRTKNIRTTVAEHDTYPQCMTALMISEATRRRRRRDRGRIGVEQHRRPSEDRRRSRHHLVLRHRRQIRTRTSWSGKSTPHCAPWSRTARGRRPRPTWASRSDTPTTRVHESAEGNGQGPRYPARPRHRKNNGGARA